MKPTQNRGQYQSNSRDDERYHAGTGRREPVGDDLFDYNRRFDTDYANFDSAHAADYQRHSDFRDEYNNMRDGYRNRGTQTGNSGASEYPDAYGNRYGRDGDLGGQHRHPEQGYRPHSSQQHSAYSQRPASGVSGYGDSGYRSSNDLAGYGGGSAYNQAGMGSFGADPDRYGSNSANSNMGGTLSGHRGKGPKGYVRSDERIREDISDRLRDDEHIDAGDIDVTVSSGDVVLSGVVESRFAKRHAEDLAESVSGVRNVENRIRVKP